MNCPGSRRAHRLVVPVISFVAVLATIMSPVSPAAAGTGLLDPVVGSQVNVDEAFAELIRASGMSVDEACLALSATVEATHALERLSLGPDPGMPNPRGRRGSHRSPKAGPFGSA